MSHTQNSIRGIRVILKKSVMQTMSDGGELKVETAEGEGATFILSLP